MNFVKKIFNDYDRSNLNKHIRFVHKGICRKKKEVSSSSHQCMECGKIYSSNSALKTHLFIHTGERPFGCNQCEKMFRRKDGLDLHTRNRHSEEKAIIMLNM